MPHKKKKNNPDDPKPIKFGRDEEKDPSDPLKKPYHTTEEERDDAEADQFNEEEGFLSSEETKLRKEDEFFS